MRQPLIDNAKKHGELQAEIADKEAKISELRRDTFGGESEETEKKARQLFAEIGSAKGGADNSEQIDELRDERNRLEVELESVKSELLEQVADIRFPLDGTIETEDGMIAFPYGDPIDSDVLKAVEDALAEDFSQNGVSINTDSITVDTKSTDEAIEAVERRVTKLRQTAEAQYDAAEQAEALYERDQKVAGMMYTLRESETPLTKNEMEDRMGLDSGELRGQLYYVLKNDPYLKKPDKQVELTSTGRMVIDEYIDQFEEPIWNEAEEGSEEVEA